MVKNRNLGNDLSNIPFNMKAGIFTTIADAIYSTTVDKIKEAVSNSMDANANNFFITLSGSNLSLLDDGSGLDKEEANKIFSNIGFGSKSGKGKFSQFGLGLFSIIRLATQSYIYTKKANKFNNIDPSVKLHDETHDNPLSSAASCLNVLGSLSNKPEELKQFLNTFNLNI